MELAIIFSGIIGIIFGLFLIYIGKRLFTVKSYEKHFQNFKANKGEFDWFDKYYLGFALFNGLGIKWSLSVFGDAFLSGWYRLSGLLFIIFGVFFILSAFTFPIISFLA